MPLQKTGKPQIRCKSLINTVYYTVGQMHRTLITKDPVSVSNFKYFNLVYMFGLFCINCMKMVIISYTQSVWTQLEVSQQ